MSTQSRSRSGGGRWARSSTPAADTRTRRPAASQPTTVDLAGRQRLLDGRFERSRQPGAPRAQWRRGIIEVLLEDAADGEGAKGRLAGEHLIGDARQAIEIAALIDRTGATGLLGAHVLRRTHRDA